MSKSDKRTVNAVHTLLMDRFPKAFPKDYDAIRPLKTGIHADLIQRLPEVDPVLLRRVLANHTDRDGYRLALLHHRGDRRYDLDGQPVGTVTVEERAEAAQLLEASTQRRQAKAEDVRIHLVREEKRQKQREMERRNREAKAARKAENLRRMEEAAARKAALIAQGIVLEPRSKHRHHSGPFPSKPRPQVPAELKIASSPPPTDPNPRPVRPPDPTSASPVKPMPQVQYKKRRLVPPPTDEGKND